MTPLDWTYLIAAIWLGIVAFVYRSVPRSPKYLRTLFEVGGGSACILILIAGGLINRVFLVEKAAATLLPQNSTAPSKPDSSEKELMIGISNDGKITLDSALVPMASLEIELGKHLSKDINLVVTIMAAPNAKYDVTNKILDICAKLKIENITFTVTEEK